MDWGSVDVDTFVEAEKQYLNNTLETKFCQETLKLTSF